MNTHEKVVIIDFGGQYAHLIASRIRRMAVFSEIVEADEVDMDYLAQDHIKGIILSGGPQSVYEEGAPKTDNRIFELGKPILGICYGHQYLNLSLGGTVTPGNDASREYGPAAVQLSSLSSNSQQPTANSQHADALTKGIPDGSTFWMSHGDTVSGLPEGFEIFAQTDSCTHAGVFHPEKQFYGIQFHPEVTHSQYGNQILQNFVEICGAKGDWTMDRFIEEKSDELKAQIGDKDIVLFVSGGVDSTVCFSFLSKILGKDRVKGLFINNGLLRHQEVAYVTTSIRGIGADLTVIDASDRFLGNLAGVSEPEKKREIIGNTFVDIQREYFAEHGLSESTLLAQGTIYPDTIESGNTKNAATIKTHHNRVPEIQKLIDEGKVVEPIADLYKDEVRALGEALGLPHELVWRHPFPGPGLGVRILCCDAADEMKNEKLKMRNEGEISYGVIPLKSVGVQGDARTYRHPAVVTIDSRQQTVDNIVPPDLGQLEQIATKLINQNAEINRCLYPLSEMGENVTLSEGYLTTDRIERLQRADHIVMSTLQEMGLYSDIWQFPVVLAPMEVGERAGSGEGAKLGSVRESIILRPIDSQDVMSARVGQLPWEFFEKVTEAILKDESISAVFLDITSKPPGTVEWE